MGAKYAEIEIGTHTASETADTAADYYTIFTLPGKYLIKSVYWVPEIAVTADGTNYSVLTLTNATASTTIATRSYIATNSVAGTAEVQTLPTGLAAVVAQGDVIKLAKTTPGTGVAVRGRYVVGLEQAPLP